MLLPVAYWLHRADQLQQDSSHQIRHAAEEVTSNFQRKLKAIELVLRGISGFVEGSDNVSAQEFHAYAASLQLDATVSGLRGVTFIPSVAAQALPKFLAEARSTYGLEGLQLHPAGRRELYAPILFVEPPQAENLAIRGLDILTLAAARDAALRARDNGQVSLSSRLSPTDYGEPVSTAGPAESVFVMYQPIFKVNDAVGADTSRKGREFVGWAGARFRMTDLARADIPGPHPDMRLQIFEGSALTEKGFLFGMLNQVPAVFFPVTSDGTSAQGHIDYGGMRWTFVVTPTPAYVAAHTDRLHHGFAVLGILLSIAAGFIVWLLMTARDRAQRAAFAMTAELRALSSDLEGTLNAVPDLLFELDAQGHYLALRTSTNQGLVVPRQELIGKSVFDILSHDAATTCLNAIAEAAQSGISTGQQIEILISGENRWYELSIARKPVSPGMDPCFVMLSRDITERKRATQKLQESERALNEAQRVAAMGHFWVDTQALRWRGSPSVCDLLGLEAGKTFALSEVASLVELRHREQFLAVCTSDENAPGIRLEFPVQRANDSRERWMLMCGQGDLEPGAEKDARFFTLQDVTERRRAEDQLKLLEKAVANLNDTVLITEAEPVRAPGPRIVFVNDAFERMTGYTSDEVLGQSPRILQGKDTSRSESDRIREALEAWKPVQAELINYTKTGQPFWVELAIQPIADEHGWYTHWVAVERDVTERKEAERKVHQLAFFDALTLLPNRSQFMLTAGERLAGMHSGALLGAAVLVDLDNFKVLNDRWGHRQGDQLLVQIAKRLSEELSTGDSLARLGGDEFMVLLNDLGAEHESAVHRVEAFCTRLLNSLSRPLSIGGRECFATASLGAVVFGESPLTVEELLAQADSAMYYAKDSGRNTYRFFDIRLQSKIADRVALEADLRQSIRKRELFLLYQPQVDSEGRVIGAEALCRWRSGARGLVSPGEFIPLAESSGFIQELGPWVLETACNLLADWRLRPGMDTLTLAVNVSARQFHHPDFVRQVQVALHRSGANPALLKLELTESIFAEDVEEIVAKMGALKALGVHFSLDDFGTGYSSLSYLKKLPLDQLKIDQSFVRDLLHDSHDEAIIRTVIALGRSLGLGVIAEGVENAAQRDFLFQSGCILYQGYLFGRPMTGEALMDHVASMQLGR